MIIPLYKKIGQTSHQMAQQLGAQTGEKATHTGTLDPAAEGVLVILTGEERFKKSSLSDGTKTYQAEIILGLATDTDDEVGLISDLQPVIKNQTKLFKEKLLEYKIVTKQNIHPFSSKRTKGTSFFELAKSGTIPPDYFQNISIKQITINKTTSVSKDDLISRQAQVLEQIKGKFRQEEIRSSWKDNLSFLKNTTQFPVISVEIQCSKRTYIRSIIRDLRLETSIPATLHSLIRTENGPYKVEDCICLVEPN